MASQSKYTPQQLAADAEKEFSDWTPYVTLAEYGEAIHILRTHKNLSWRAINEWLEAKGLRYSTGAANNAYKAWLAENPARAKEEPRGLA